MHEFAEDPLSAAVTDYVDEIEENAAPKVEDYLKMVDYSSDDEYVPSDFALELVNFIKLVEGGNPENKTPVVHYKMIDKMVNQNDLDTINLCHRGIAKSTLKEYIILYIAVFGVFPGLGKVPYAIYVSDSIDNGVKRMRKSLEYRWQNSPFLQEWVPSIKFTDIRWEFIAQDGRSLVVSGHGAKTGVRGTRENNTRPILALLDDLISDEDARSPTVISSVEDTVHKAVDFALHPQRRKIIWSGTPFNAKDPLYKAVESGAWAVNVFPVCERFPCTREEFRGSWEDRFDYDYVLSQYTKKKKSGKLDTFNQELMLQIMSDEDRLIQDSEIRWYERTVVLSNRDRFNFYITTDFATKDKEHNDYSVISVWAYNNNGDWLWVDGIVEKQDMGKNVDDLFSLAQEYSPQSVGIEINGQQGGFIPWLQSEMLHRNIWFNLAPGKGGQPGLARNTSKLEQFNQVVPWFKAGKFFFPIEMKDSKQMQEAYDELSLASRRGFRSKYDDFIDTISMLAHMKAWKPSHSGDLSQKDATGTGSPVWGIHDENEPSALASYIV